MTTNLDVEVARKGMKFQVAVAKVPNVHGKTVGIEASTGAVPGFATRTVGVRVIGRDQGFLALMTPAEAIGFAKALLLCAAEAIANPPSREDIQ